jgi:hypothetical protein
MPRKGPPLDALEISLKAHWVWFQIPGLIKHSKVYKPPELRKITLKGTYRAVWCKEIKKEIVGLRESEGGSMIWRISPIDLKSLV